MVEKKKKIVAITQARMGSTRLPGKVLMKVKDQSFLEIHSNRLSKAKMVDEIIVATTTSPIDDVIVDHVSNLDYLVSRGSENDVLDRYYKTAIDARADVIVRVTSDCPLIDPELIDKIIYEHLKESKDFTSNVVKRTYPDGNDIEVFSMNALTMAWKNSYEASEREHVTYYIWKNSNLLGGKLFSAHNVIADRNEDFSFLRLTLDYPEDFKLITTLINYCGVDKSWRDYVNILINNPSLIEVNKKFAK